MSAQTPGGFQRLRYYPAFRGGAAILFLVMSLQACTHTMVLTSTAPQQDYDRVNREFAGRSAKLRLGSGGVFDILNVRLAPDSVRYMSPRGSVALPVQDLISAEYRDRTRGLWEGALLGGLVAGVLFAFLGGASSTDSDEPFHLFGCQASTSACAAGGFALGAFGGAFYGAIIGAIRQSRVKVLWQPGLAN